MKKLYKTLGLNKLEQKVVTSVAKDFMMVADIARVIDVPRTSVDAVVVRLVERNILKKKKESKRYYYKKISDIETIQNMFPSTALPQGKYSLPLYDGFELNIYSGAKEIMQMFERLCIKNSKDRVYGIQSSSSVIEMFKYASLEEINYINGLVTANGVVQETIIDEDYFVDLKKIIENTMGEDYGKWLGGLADRIAIVHMLPKEDIGFNGLLILYEKIALLVDWKTETAIEIKNNEMMKMLLAMFRSFKKQGKRIELRDVYDKYMRTGEVG